MVGNTQAANQLHDEIRPAGIRGYGIVHLGDVRMIHDRQGLALRLEPGNDGLSVHAELDDLQRDTSAHRFFLFGHIYDAPPALTDSLQNLVTTDPLANVLLR